MIRICNCKCGLCFGYAVFCDKCGETSMICSSSNVEEAVNYAKKVGFKLTEFYWLCEKCLEKTNVNR